MSFKSFILFQILTFSINIRINLSQCQSIGPRVTNGQTNPAPCNTGEGLSCTIICDSGYKVFDGNTQITCRGGKWIPSQLPLCQKEDTICSPNLVAPQDATLSGVCQNAQPLQQCFFSCNNGQSPVPNTPIITCLATGFWNNYPLPSCPALQCPRLNPPINGGFENAQLCGPASAGTTCTLRCDSGYTLTGPAQVICQSNGFWFPSQPTTCFRQTCRNLIRPVNGNFSGTCEPGLNGQTCVFRCSTGYAISGAAALTCQSNGQWNGIEPTCVPIFCEGIDFSLYPDAAIIEGDGCRGSGAGVCNVICKNGDAFTVICVNGQWDDTIVCPPTLCPAKYPPSDGFNYGYCSPGQVGETCTFACADGFSLINGPLEITCTATGWNTEVTPICVEFPRCPAVGGVDNGAIDGPGCNGDALFGDTCTLTCNDGYSSDTTDITCGSDGKWDDTLGPCDINQCPPQTAPLPNGDFQGQCSPGLAQQTCTFICPAGYVIDGVTSVTCNDDGTWDADTPRCIKKNCPNMRLKNGVVAKGQCTPGVLGMPCHMSCARGYKMMGKKTTALCANGGKWNGKPPKCLRQCPKISSANGRLSGTCSPGVQNSLCTLSCRSGYRIRGAGTVLCKSDGRWSGASPRCVRSCNG